MTQMYFPNDPLFPFDPIMQSVPDARARERLVSRFDLELTEPEWALGLPVRYRVAGTELDAVRGQNVETGSGL